MKYLHIFHVRVETSRTYALPSLALDVDLQIVILDS